MVRAWELTPARPAVRARLNLKPAVGMRSKQSGILVTIAVLLATWTPGQGKESPTPPPQRSGTDLWIKAMLDARALVAREQSAPDKAGSFKPFVSDAIDGAGPGQAISIDVRGVKTLRLITQQTQSPGNLQIWGSARLIAPGGKSIWLDQFTPVSIMVGWGQLNVNRNWRHEPLQIGDRQFDHGLWVHADSELAFALDGKYERFEAWIGMDHARPGGAAIFKVLSGAADAGPGLWRQLARKYPTQCAWLAQDLGLACETQWLLGGADTGRDQQIIQHAIAALGGLGAPLADDFKALKQNSAGPQDSRWLTLYARACRARQCLTGVQSTATIAIRQELEQHLRAAIEARLAADDSRWATILDCANAAKCDSGIIDLPSLRKSAEALAQSWADRYISSPEISAQLAAIEKLAADLSVAARDLNPERLAATADLQARHQQARRELVRSLSGMREFLDQWAATDLSGEWESQHAVLQTDLRNRAGFEKVASETHRQAALILGSDRDPLDVVLRRTAALVQDLKQTPAGAQIATLENDLAQVAAAAAKVDVALSDARFVLYAQVCKIRRQVALRNPLLDFNELVFIKRHRAIFNHMCDQYYGMAQHPGGGLYVLSGAFGPQPKVRDLLADAVVENGRLKGQKLSGGPLKSWNIKFDGLGNLSGEETEGGSFLSPELSYDGKKILFAYVECKGDRNHWHHVDHSKGHWEAGRCYHIFSVNADGTGLRMLTDGTWNDFDPCWLPNGRIAFITERRGGYLRCGRACPTFTLYDMAADGSDITMLSPHETNEWNPSVTNDGRILYTRWDYVDRFGCTAHHPWITTLDGRDSRAVHGNFAPRNERPDMELDCRAIPNSHRFIATAAPHHGQAFGSLVLVDPTVDDAEPMAPIKRITPDVAFPESQGGGQVYGMAWPLSEDYFLCAYDPAVTSNVGGQGTPLVRGNYGLYLVDAWGNKELLYRDAQIASISPIPLKARPVPAASPALAMPARNAPGTQQPPPGQKMPEEGTIVLANAYDSLFPWPAGTRIKSLRIMQVLPMTVPSGSNLAPHDTGIRIAMAPDSVVPVRHVLGTVPVEEDGSAHFTVPANRELFFQALDEHGLAIQSMRSATYLHPGERLVCQGCHEPRHRAPGGASARTPLALLKTPVKPIPDVDGSRPFSYPRLVQPVLDRHCVSCHSPNASNPGKSLNLTREPIQRKFYASYMSLAPKYGFTSYGNNLVTVPGQFGAKASKLLDILERGHYDVKLPSEDLHRITLWLDCSSMFYGVYEKEGGEAQLKGEIAWPTLE